MKTMNRTSKPAMLIYGAVLGLIASAAAALTGTGLIGIYGFGLLGMTVLFTYLMWPERTRFIRDSSAPTTGGHRNRRGQRRRRRTGAL